MSRPRIIKVAGKDGILGTTEARSRSLVGQEKQVAIRLADGRRIMVPGTLLQPSDDGNLYLPFNLEELASQQGGPEGSVLTVPVVEETLHVQKRPVERGRVRVRKVVHEHEEVIDQPILQEDVEVERVPVNRPVNEPVPIRYEGETMVVSLLEEVLVVEKRLILREELRITKRQTEVSEVRRVKLRGEEAIVERLPGATPEEDRPDSP